MRLLTLLMVGALLPGCSRAFYRLSADKETYGAVAERLDNPQWDLPRIALDPSPESRLFDPYDPDHPPMPPDDPAAHRYMVVADGRPGYRKWHKDGDAPWIESPYWKEFLKLSDEGELELNPDRAIDLGLLNSREYQTALEAVYLSALALTLDRFQFDLQWFNPNSTRYQHSGRGANESNTLTTTSNLGFNKAFTGGAQLLVEFANSWVWEFTGPNRGITASNIVVNLVQPLLRGGGRDFRMEPLTQAERDVLYAVRDFARFRKQYSVDVAVSGYLSFLLQLQGIRNQEENLVRLRRSLDIHEGFFRAGNVSQVQVDQVFQSLQAGRLALIRQQNQLETALDDYKITLGLPPSVKVKLDDSALAPFQLNDPALTKLQGEVQKAISASLQVEKTLPLKDLLEEFKQLKAWHGRAEALLGSIREETERWKRQFDETKDKADEVQRKRLRGAQEEMLTERLPRIREDLEKVAKGITAGVVDLTEKTREKGQANLHNLYARLAEALDRLFNLQTEVRVYLIRLQPVPYTLEQATAYALAYRLDLMNEQARVTDAWRKIAVTANALEANLDVSFNANVGTIPGGTNPVDFNARASSYRVGLQFDSPLNRLAERNAFRAAQINYQRSRRAFMALDDRIQRAIRFDLRNLETERLNFEIARQSLIAAVRQVRAVQGQQLLAEKVDPVSTINLLNAFAAVLNARDTLIGSWVSYETGRIQLLLDMEILQLDARGFFADEHRNHPDLPAPTPVPDGERPEG